MSESLEITVQYSDEDYIRGMLFSQGESYIYRYNYLIFGLSGIIGFFVSYYLIYKREISPDFGLILKVLIASIIGIPIFYLLRDVLPTQEKFYKRFYNSSPLLRETYKILIDSEGINSESRSLSNKLYWQGIIKLFKPMKIFIFSFLIMLHCLFRKEFLPMHSKMKLGI